MRFADIPWGLALCRQVGWELFFSSNAQDHRRAKVVCRNCPIRTMCYEYAVSTQEFDNRNGRYRMIGVWGGQLFSPMSESQLAMNNSKDLLVYREQTNMRLHTPGILAGRCRHRSCLVPAGEYCKGMYGIARPHYVRIRDADRRERERLRNAS